MEKCPECHEQYGNSLKMLAHARYVHKFNQETVYRKLHNIVDNPVCECGCKALVPYITFSIGYRKYARGHVSRVKNNFNTEKSMNNSIKKRREMLKDGTWKPYVSNETGTVWNTGLTKEDPRVAKQIAKRETPEYKVISSKRMKEARLNGIMPTLYGKNSSQWKGGITALSFTCRTNVRLYKEWKYPILRQAQFKCSKCSSVSGVEVHHDKETFSEIYSRIAYSLDYPLRLTEAMDPDADPTINELKLFISDAVAQYHIDNNVSGVVLCEDCHKKQHLEEK